MISPWLAHWGLGAGGQGRRSWSRGPPSSVLHTPSHAYTRPCWRRSPPPGPRRPSLPPVTGSSAERGLPWDMGLNPVHGAGPCPGARGANGHHGAERRGQEHPRQRAAGSATPPQGAATGRDSSCRWQKLYQDPVQAFASRVRLATQFDDVLRLQAASPSACRLSGPVGAG